MEKMRVVLKGKWCPIEGKRARLSRGKKYISFFTCFTSAWTAQLSCTALLAPFRKAEVQEEAKTASKT